MDTEPSPTLDPSHGLQRLLSIDELADYLGLPKQDDL